MAYEFFKLINHNREVEDDWKGQMNMTYTYGGKLRDAKLEKL